MEVDLDGGWNERQVMEVMKIVGFPYSRGQYLFGIKWSHLLLMQGSQVEDGRRRDWDLLSAFRWSFSEIRVSA